jgi:hypothetical protein
MRKTKFTVRMGRVATIHHKTDVSYGKTRRAVQMGH